MRASRVLLLPVLVLVAALLPALPSAAAGPGPCPPGDSGAGSLQVRARPGAAVPEPAADPGPDLLDPAVLARRPAPTLRTAATLSPAGSVSIPTYVHVIAQGPTRAEGYLTRAEVDRQLAVLNRSYSGTTGPDTPFRFRKVAISWTVAPHWYDMLPDSTAERQAKTALRRGDDQALNVYLSRLGGGLFGWSTMPQSDDGLRPWRDGVVIDTSTMPGGTMTDYNEGDTLPHEVGHWLGLLHTFEGGCGPTGDRVADTPKELDPTIGCPVGKDTCSAPGNDPVRNFMDYSYDRCMNTFTRGQVVRMDQVWKAYRAGAA